MKITFNKKLKVYQVISSFWGSVLMQSQYRKDCVEFKKQNQ